MRPLVALLTLATAAVTTPVLAAPARPTFAVMDDTGDGTELEADLALIDDRTDFGSGYDSELVLRGRLHAQYVSSIGAGAYASIGTMRGLIGEDSETGEAFSALGNAQLGALYQRALGDVALAARAGVILPTADDRGYDMVEHAFFTLVSRPSDLALAAPEATWLRLGLSPTYRRGPLVARVDLGADVAVRKAEETGETALGHVNVGVAYAWPRVTASAEVLTLFEIAPDADPEPFDYPNNLLDGNVFHVAALSARYHAEHAAPYLAMSMPLDDGGRGNYLTLTVGITASL
jgi:hypothetical protein